MENDEEFYFKEIGTGLDGKGAGGYVWTHKIPVFANWLLLKRSLFVIISLYVILTVAITIIVIMHFMQPGSGLFCFFICTFMMIFTVLCVFLSTLYVQVVHGGDDGEFMMDDRGVHSVTGMGLLLTADNDYGPFHTDLRWDNIRRVTIYPEAGAIDFKEKSWGFPITAYCEPGYIPPPLIRYIARHVSPDIIEYA